MKKKRIFIGTAFVGVLSLSACGKTELQPVAAQVEIELGSLLDENVTSYVTLDEKAAKEAELDLSAVDINKTGTYAASVTYKEQTAAFEVVVKDTTAPEVTLVDKVTVAAGMPLHAKDVIAEVTELSGEVTAVFEKAEPEKPEQPEGIETLTENTDSAVVTKTETVIGTELPMPGAVEEIGQMKGGAETFITGAVTCTDDIVVFGTAGDYKVRLTVADASGNETDTLVSVIVGEAPEFLGIEDLAVTVGTERVDYLDGVTATDYQGADITDRIVCDAAAVKLDTVGTYEILYRAADGEGFCAEKRASVTVTEKKSEKSSGKRTSEKKQANTGNADAGNNTGNSGTAGASSQPSGNSGAPNNAGNVGTAGASSQPSGNSGAPNNAGNIGTAGASSQPSGNSGALNNTGNVGTAGASSQSSGNAGNRNQNAGNAEEGADQNAGTAGSTGNTENSGGTDNSGSTGNGNMGNAGSGDAGFSGTTQEEWENMGFEEFIPQPGTGADDGTDLGGSSTWH